MQETAKGIARRLREPNHATRYFVGAGIDIGSGDDPITRYVEFFPLVSSVRCWDLADGNAQYLHGVPDENFDWVYSSHCLEHIEEPNEALHNWFRVLKRGGHLIVVVPDEDMYEYAGWPSANGGHLWSFTIYKHKSAWLKSLNLTDLITYLPACDVIKLERLTGTYRFKAEPHDQTQTPIGESAIEMILRKL